MRAGNSLEATVTKCPVPREPRAERQVNSLLLWPEPTATFCLRSSAPPDAGESHDSVLVTNWTVSPLECVGEGTSPQKPQRTGGSLRDSVAHVPYESYQPTRTARDGRPSPGAAMPQVWAGAGVRSPRQTPSSTAKRLCVLGAGYGRVRTLISPHLTTPPDLWYKSFGRI